MMLAPLQDASIAALVEEAMDSARDLAAEEMRLTLAEVDAQVASIRRAVLFGFSAALLAGAALSWAGVALVMALGLGAWGTGILAILGIGSAALAAVLARRTVPTPILADTRARLERRVSNVKEALK